MTKNVNAKNLIQFGRLLKVFSVIAVNRFLKTINRNLNEIPVFLKDKKKLWTFINIVSIPFVYQFYRAFDFEDDNVFMGYPNLRTFAYIVCQSVVFIQIVICLFLLSYKKDVFTQLVCYYLFIFSIYTIGCKIFLIDYLIVNFLLGLLLGTVIFIIVKFIKLKFYSRKITNRIDDELFYYQKYQEILFQLHHEINHELASIEGLTSLLVNGIDDPKIAKMLNEKAKQLRLRVTAIEKIHRL